MRGCLLIAGLCLATLLTADDVDAHTIEVVTQAPMEGRPTAVLLEGMAMTGPPTLEVDVERDGSTIRVYASIFSGVLPTFTPYSVTTSLGRLPAGEYEVIYFARYAGITEYKQFDAEQFGVRPAIAVPAVDRWSIIALIAILLVVGGRRLGQG